jgi:hypothetical protein
MRGYLFVSLILCGEDPVLHQGLQQIIPTTYERFQTAGLHAFCAVVSYPQGG